MIAKSLLVVLVALSALAVANSQVCLIFFSFRLVFFYLFKRIFFFDVRIFFFVAYSSNSFTKR